MNGLNVEMPGQTYMGQALLDSVRAGVVPETKIDERVRELLRVRLAIQPIPQEEANRVMTAQPEQAQIAYDVAAKSIVLLKNEGSLLPVDLNKTKRIAVIGENAVRTMGLGGVGAGVKAWNEITPLQGLRNRIGNHAEIVYAQGYKGYTSAERNNRRERISPYRAADPKLMAEAVRVAKDADLVLFIGGTNREVETEGSDRNSIELPSGQDELIAALMAANPNTVAVMVAGAPLDLNEVEATVPAIVYSWFNGSEAGHALADVLLGTISPSGKLPFTFPTRLEDSPAYALGTYPQQRENGADVFVDLTQNRRYARRSLQADYSEGLYVGYRWFDKKDIAPLYPFGYGLSYATFDYSDIATDKTAYAPSDTIRVSFTLGNSSGVTADEVPQLYVSREGSAVNWPKKELKSFGRVTLDGGQSQTVTLAIPVGSLRYWDETTDGWQIEHCTIRIAVGASSEDLRLETRVKI
jgi:beta-glucosidase